MLHSNTKVATERKYRISRLDESSASARLRSLMFPVDPEEVRTFGPSSPIRSARVSHEPPFPRPTSYSDENLPPCSHWNHETGPPTSRGNLYSQDQFVLNKNESQDYNSNVLKLPERRRNGVINKLNSELQRCGKGHSRWNTQENFKIQKNSKPTVSPSSCDNKYDFRKGLKNFRDPLKVLADDRAQDNIFARMSTRHCSQDFGSSPTNERVLDMRLDTDLVIPPNATIDIHRRPSDFFLNAPQSPCMSSPAYHQRWQTTPPNRRAELVRAHDRSLDDIMISTPASQKKEAVMREELICHHWNKFICLSPVGPLHLEPYGGNGSSPMAENNGLMSPMRFVSRNDYRSSFSALSPVARSLSHNRANTEQHDDPSVMSPMVVISTSKRTLQTAAPILRRYPKEALSASPDAPSSLVPISLPTTNYAGSEQAQEDLNQSIDNELSPWSAATAASRRRHQGCDLNDKSEKFSVGPYITTRSGAFSRARADDLKKNHDDDWNRLTKNGQHQSSKNDAVSGENINDLFDISHREEPLWPLSTSLESSKASYTANDPTGTRAASVSTKDEDTIADYSLYLKKKKNHLLSDGGSSKRCTQVEGTSLSSISIPDSAISSASSTSPRSYHHRSLASCSHRSNNEKKDYSTSKQGLLVPSEDDVAERSDGSLLSCRHKSSKQYNENSIQSTQKQREGFYLDEKRSNNCNIGSNRGSGFENQSDSERPVKPNLYRFVKPPTNTCDIGYNRQEPNRRRHLYDKKRDDAAHKYNIADATNNNEEDVIKNEHILLGAVTIVETLLLKPHLLDVLRRRHEQDSSRLTQAVRSLLNL
eukprot:GHVL01005278.1.p1 GENE.GHVL01005278.1~~GHVL01005278.1.p1  ORF type:complete len:820 (-),score=157.33 GHVL01005278.1:3237-5696(-)